MGVIKKLCMSHDTNNDRKYEFIHCELFLKSIRFRFDSFQYESIFKHLATSIMDVLTMKIFLCMIFVSYDCIIHQFQVIFHQL